MVGSPGYEDKLQIFADLIRSKNSLYSIDLSFDANRAGMRKTDKGDEY